MALALRDEKAQKGPMAGVEASILHRDVVAKLAGERAFTRGQSYFRDGRVVDLVRRDASLSGQVRGSTTYAVRLWVGESNLAFSCTCPQGQESVFCKHAVAVALAWIARAATRSPS
jgi:uncharacterized Zn finger protein